MLIKPRGKMTKGIESKFEVGAFVRLLEDNAAEFVSRGDVGIIRRVYAGNPDDGDKTWVAYDVYWADAGIVETTQTECIARASKSQYVAKLVRPIVRQLTRRAEDLAGIGVSGRALEVACGKLVKA